MALCVLATAWKKAAGRKAADGEGSVASAFVDGLLGIVVDHGLRSESSDEARLVRDRVRSMGILYTLPCRIYCLISSAKFFLLFFYVVELLHTIFFSFGDFHFSSTVCVYK